jgi:hypothetical protein
LDLYLLRSQHSRRARHSTCTVGEWERDHKTSASELDSCYAVLAWWTRGDEHQSMHDFYWHLCAYIDVIAKFLLLFYKSGRLRIVISTANLMKHDWRDIENTVWVQDVPRRPSPIPHEPKADDFASVFERVLCAINVAPAITHLVSTDVRRTCNILCSPMSLTRFTEAPQHSAHGPVCGCAPHTLGLLPRTTNACPEPRREAQGLACRPQVRSHGPQTRGQPAQPTTTNCLARVSGTSPLQETSEVP